MPTTFAEILGAIRVEDFLREIWGVRFAHLPGERGGFKSLLAWDEVNAILQRHRLEPPRLRLVRNGEFAPKDSYLRYEGNRFPFVIPEKLSARLRDGYTLIIDAVDDMAPAVMGLAEDFERTLHESIQANLYAGWQEQQGFHRHCDTHDVVVLQIHGRKHWRVYEGGRPHPLKDDIVPNKIAPDAVIWDGVLEEGDALYIPRGWWHEASGIGEVTLHLTFGIHQRTGLNLSHWLVSQLRASEAFRADLLRFGTPQEQSSQIAELRELLIAQFDDDVLHRYFSFEDARARSRGWSSLPWSVRPDESMTHVATLTIDSPRPLSIVREGASVVFEANNRRWKFASSAEPLLQRLQAGPASLAALADSTNGALDAETIRLFVLELAREGLVRIEEGRP